MPTDNDLEVCNEGLSYKEITIKIHLVFKIYIQLSQYKHNKYNWISKSNMSVLYESLYNDGARLGDLHHCSKLGQDDHCNILWKWFIKGSFHCDTCCFKVGCMIFPISWQ